MCGSLRNQVQSTLYFSQTSVIYLCRNSAAVSIIGVSVKAKCPQGKRMTLTRGSKGVHNTGSWLYLHWDHCCGKKIMDLLSLASFKFRLIILFPSATWEWGIVWSRARCRRHKLPLWRQTFQFADVVNQTSQFSRAWKVCGKYEASTSACRVFIRVLCATRP